MSCPPINTSNQLFIHQYVHPWICPLINTFLQLSAHQYIHPPVHPSIHSCIYPPINTSMHLSTHQYIHTTVCPSTHTYVQLSAHQHTVNILKIRKSKVHKTCSKFASKRSKNSIYWATLKFGKTSNFGKGGTPGYCLMAI